MKYIFIVYSDNDVKVVSQSVLAKDINKGLKPGIQGMRKVSQKDILSYAHDLVVVNSGRSISETEYNEMKEDAIVTLLAYSSMSPYQLFQSFKNSKE